MASFLSHHADRILNPRGYERLVILGFLVVLHGASSLLVYWSGGTSLAYVHIFYIPILLTGLSFGLRGGLVSGFLSALLAGPLMPADVTAGLLQPTQSWVVRSLYFLLVGGFAGFASNIFRQNVLFLKEQLTTNPLTKLPNLHGFDLLWRSQFSGENPKPAALFIVHCHQLDRVDKALGPDATQKIIQDIAEKIQKTVAGRAVMSHFDTGSFAVLPIGDVGAEQLIEDCRIHLGHTFLYNGIPLFLEIFYGIAPVESDDDTATSLIRKARIAADKSIGLSKEKSQYDAEDDRRAGRSLRILHDLSEAIAKQQLTLFYQPKINLKTGAVEGVEALVRWPHPTLGMVPPAEFIPLAERTLLINPFTSWLLDQAFAQLKSWQDLGIHVGMSLNFSMRNFQDPTLFLRLQELLKRYQIDPSLLEIEVTETSVAENLRKVADVMGSMQNLGVKIAVDDFGTGQSSLHYLFELPINVLKIDQIFVKSMLSNSAAEAIVRSAIYLGHELGLSVVAEGIETEEQLTRLTHLGCDYGQGFRIAKPMAASAMTAWLSGEKPVLSIR